MKDPTGDYMWVDIGPMKQPHVVTWGFLPERTPVGTGKQRKNPGEDKHPTRNRERGVFFVFAIFYCKFTVFLDPRGVFYVPGVVFQGISQMFDKSREILETPRNSLI